MESNLSPDISGHCSASAAHDAHLSSIVPNKPHLVPLETSKRSMMSDTLDDESMVNSGESVAQQPQTESTSTDHHSSGFTHSKKMGETKSADGSSDKQKDGNAESQGTSNSGGRVGGNSGTLDLNTVASKGQHLIRSIQDHALIGNLKTAALISLDGSIESMCIPYFDSPR